MYCTLYSERVSAKNGFWRIKRKHYRHSQMIFPPERAFPFERSMAACKTGCRFCQYSTTLNIVMKLFTRREKLISSCSADTSWRKLSLFEVEARSPSHNRFSRTKVTDGKGTRKTEAGSRFLQNDGE